MNGAVACIELYDEVCPRTDPDFMAQCRPCHRVSGFPLLSGPLTDQESRREVDPARGHGVNGQEGIEIPQGARADLQ